MRTDGWDLNAMRGDEDRPVVRRLSINVKNLEVKVPIDLEFLRAHPSAALPPSPLTPSSFAMSHRPQAPTPSHLHPRGQWSYHEESFESPVSPSSAYIVESPSTMLKPPTIGTSQSHPHDSPEDDTVVSDSGHSHTSMRSPNIPSLPDPSQYPDPYPYRSQHWHGPSTPALSSADSASISTRSSAYTSYARSGDYGHVHVAQGGDDSGIGGGMAISKEGVEQLMASEAGLSSSAKTTVTNLDQSRWSEVYTQNTRSRATSSARNSKTESTLAPGNYGLRTTASFDQSWDAVDERDEAGLTSDEETDDEALLDEEDEQESEEQATSAAVVAEEGRGIIVRGEDVPIVQLQVKPGTTHLLIGSSTTPNSVPAFLTTTVPQIATSLLALDISANFLVALPPALQACVCLEELNVASNPLRALPVFLAGLTSLRVLIADSTGLGTLPPALCALNRLHTLSIRRNKMHSLPSWLCQLTSLETLLVDGNPFQGPWKALVEPLLAKTPMTPLYPPSTPIFPLPSASIASVQSTPADTDVEDMSDPSSPDRENSQAGPTEEEDHTITPARAPQISRAVTSPMPIAQPPPEPPMLSRTRTTPNRAYYDKSRPPSKSVVGSSARDVAASSSSRIPDMPSNAEHEVRKMKSAGELRRNYANLTASIHQSNSVASSPQRPVLAHYPTSASSSNLLAMNPSPHDDQLVPKRFASLGMSAALSPGDTRPRPAVDTAMWDNTSDDSERSRGPTPSPNIGEQAPQPSMGSPSSKLLRENGQMSDSRQKDESKSTRWGFLKKMSMGKMRDNPQASKPAPLPRGQSSSHSRPATIVKAASQSVYADSSRASFTPQIDVRISTTGALLQGAQDAHFLAKKPSRDLLTKSLPPSPIPESSASQTQENVTTSIKSPPPSAGSGLLSPTGPTSRSAKRRSFLPIDMAPLPVHAPLPFIPGVPVVNDVEETEKITPAKLSPLRMESVEQIQRREEERAREARVRALRSVMAYLKDMNDLGLTQVNTMSIYGATSDASGLRSRRPTMVENRMPSDGSMSSSASRPETASHLRSPESRMGLRSGSATQTNSVATTDSGSGGEERKYKDDKAKRARILREIVETERTYVKGLQELADIYIKPAAAPATSLSGVGQTVVPAAESKVVFSGLESLFSFHKGSFLPALEKATAPIMKSSAELAEIDVDGQLSLNVARAVAHIFVSHAAFMKMYSTYINNFDNSVQRIKAWVSDRPATPGSALSPSSSSTQLVGLGLTMSAVTTPGVMPDIGPSNNAAPLTSSQKKRIKSYLKRCRMNPRHSQLNLEGYLLLPIQRIPRYRLLLEELVRNSSPVYDYIQDPLESALAEISSLATNMNEGKREAEARRKLVQWQSRIRGKFPSPLVQPHRRLIMDGALHLTRVVRKATLSFEVIDSKGDASTVQVECLSPELTPRSLIGVLCNDLLVLCRDPSHGQDPNSQVDLWAVLRMQTLPQPASIVHGNALRLVDNKAILYFDAPSTSDALTWFRAINLHIPASKA